MFFYELLSYFHQNELIRVKELSIHQIREIKQSLEAMVFRNITDSLQENMTTTEYFINAADDIILFYKLIKENKTMNSGWNEDDLAYYDFLQVDLNKNKDFFNRLFLFFENGIPSIYMRYFTFEFDGLSSGEEALLNLYSRIFWIYHAQNCKKESLILIDEIDLYMHPMWQRELVNYLVEDIKNLIGNKNKTQIIITTHSPIFLSDIPRANIVFLRNENGECVVDDNNEHKNTFANNVHTLFLDSFFLDQNGTMGAFAQKKINEILRMLRSEERIDDKDKRILKTIECIGDSLIKEKLLELYDKNQGLSNSEEKMQPSLDEQTIDNTITVLKRQVDELNRSIKCLEQMKND